MFYDSPRFCLRFGEIYDKFIVVCKRLTCIIFITFHLLAFDFVDIFFLDILSTSIYEIFASLRWSF